MNINDVNQMLDELHITDNAKPLIFNIIRKSQEAIVPEIWNVSDKYYNNGRNDGRRDTLRNIEAFHKDQE